MYSAEFIFEPGQYDDQFHSLDSQIQAAAEISDGYLGREVWHSADGKKISAVYYWRDRKSLKAFSVHPKHLEAKRQYSKWYKGFHIVISRVERSYGDGNISHITPNERGHFA